VRVEAVIHGYPCNRYKQKSRRLLAFLRGVVTPLVTPRRKMGKTSDRFVSKLGRKPRRFLTNPW
jgi:hypothetical protein